MRQKERSVESVEKMKTRYEVNPRTVYEALGKHFRVFYPKGRVTSRQRVLGQKVKAVVATMKDSKRGAK